MGQASDQASDGVVPEIIPEILELIKILKERFPFFFYRQVFCVKNLEDMYHAVLQHSIIIMSCYFLESLG